MSLFYLSIWRGKTVLWYVGHVISAVLFPVRFLSQQASKGLKAFIGVGRAGTRPRCINLLKVAKVQQ